MSWPSMSYTSSSTKSGSDAGLSGGETPDEHFTIWEKEGQMKTMRCIFAVLILVLSLSGFSQAAGNEGSPTLTVSGPDSMDKKATVEISGKGFTPGKDINLLFTAQDGMQSDIGYALEPVPKADQNGNWNTTWKCYDFIRRKMVKAGAAYKITATDTQYTPLAHTNVAFKK